MAEVDRPGFIDSTVSLLELQILFLPTSLGHHVANNVLVVQPAADAVIPESFTGLGFSSWTM